MWQPSEDSRTTRINKKWARSAEEQKRRPIKMKMKMKIIIIIYNSTFDSESALSFWLSSFLPPSLVSIVYYMSTNTHRSAKSYLHTLCLRGFIRVRLLLLCFHCRRRARCSLLAAELLLLLLSYFFSIFSNQCRHWLFRLCIPIFFPFSSPHSPRCSCIAVVAIIIIKYRSRAMCFDLMMVLWLYQVHKIELRQQKERNREKWNEEEEIKKKNSIKKRKSSEWERDIYMYVQNHYLIDWNWSERLM